MTMRERCPVLGLMLYSLLFYAIISSLTLRLQLDAPEPEAYLEWLHGRFNLPISTSRRQHAAHHHPRTKTSTSTNAITTSSSSSSSSSSLPSSSSSGRVVLSGLRGCHRLNPKQGEECCLKLDGRTDEEFGFQDCVPAKTKFSSGNNCEPVLWVREGHKHEADSCPNGIDWSKGKNIVKASALASQAQMGRKIAALNNINPTELCETALGPKGFSEEWNMCKRTSSTHSSTTSSQAYCRHNPVSGSTYCMLSKLTLLNDLIKVSKGGEEISAVMGRTEAQEFPVYSPGALSLSCFEDEDSISHKHATNYYPHHLKLITNALTFDPTMSCDQDAGTVVSDTVMLVTRYEYANLFHQMTDWYNVFVVAMKEDLLDQPLRFVFLDGHPKGALDDAWDLFSKATIQNQQPKTTTGGGFIRVASLPAKSCFSRAILMPMGYRSPVDVHGMISNARSCQNDPRVDDFRKLVVGSWLNLPIERAQGEMFNIGMIFRRDYIAHPRAGSGRASRKISNEDEVLRALKQLRDPSGVWQPNVITLSLEQLKFYDQVKIITTLNTLIGVHGAALSYALWMQPDSDLIEIASGNYRGRFHFEFYSIWAGVHYTKLDAKGGEKLTLDVNSLKQAVEATITRHSTNKN